MGDVFYKVAYFFLGTDISLAQKLSVSTLHSDFADLQILCQGPLGGQFLPRLQIARQNVGTDTAVERFIQRDTGGFFQFVS